MLLQTKFYRFLLHRTARRLNLVQWDETIFGFFQDFLYNIRFHEILSKNSRCNRLKNWRNISWKCDGIEMCKYCEYGVLEITSDAKVSSHEWKTSDLTRLLYHAWFPKLHTNISTLTVLALLKNTNKQKETTNERRYPFQSSCDSNNQCSQIWVHWLLNYILQSM